MAVAFDEEKDERWITIHPNGAEKGKHVKVNGEGEVVAGNKHLVKALNEKSGAVVKQGDGAAHLKGKAPPFASFAAKGNSARSAGSSRSSPRRTRASLPDFSTMMPTKGVKEARLLTERRRGPWFSKGIKSRSA